MPLRQRRVLNILNLCLPSQALVRVRVGVRAGGHAEHAHDWVFLEEFVVHLQDLVAGQELLMLRVLHLGVALTVEAKVRIDISSV